MRRGTRLRLRTLRMALTLDHQREVSGNAAHHLSDETSSRCSPRAKKRREKAAEASRRPGAPSRRRRSAPRHVLAYYLPRSSTMRSCAASLRGHRGDGRDRDARDGKVMKAVTPGGRAVPRAVASQAESAVSSAQPDFRKSAEINSAEDLTASCRSNLQRCFDSAQGVAVAVWRGLVAGDCGGAPALPLPLPRRCPSGLLFRGCLTAWPCPGSTACWSTGPERSLLSLSGWRGRRSCARSTRSVAPNISPGQFWRRTQAGTGARVGHRVPSRRNRVEHGHAGQVGGVAPDAANGVPLPLATWTCRSCLPPGSWPGSCRTRAFGS